jgi:hypothetical protein
MRFGPERPTLHARILQPPGWRVRQLMSEADEETVNGADYIVIMAHKCATMDEWLERYGPLRDA